MSILHRVLAVFFKDLECEVGKWQSDNESFYSSSGEVERNLLSESDISVSSVHTNDLSYFNSDSIESESEVEDQVEWSDHLHNVTVQDFCGTPGPLSPLS